jgi:hypothetical protein
MVAFALALLILALSLAVGNHLHERGDYEHPRK